MQYARTSLLSGRIVYSQLNAILDPFDRGHINDQSMTKSPFSRKRESPETLGFELHPRSSQNQPDDYLPK